MSGTFVHKSLTDTPAFKLSTRLHRNFAASIASISIMCLSRLSAACLCILLWSAALQPAGAQYVPVSADSVPALPDSVSQDSSVARVRHQELCKYGSRWDKFTTSKFYRMTFIGVPLVAGGLIIKSKDDHFRSLRNDYMPRFRRHVDDYLQYAPMAVMFGLKAGGVTSRSSWGRMLASDAFSAALMAGVVNTLKHTTKVERPDGSNNRSFPSGHTATAFMAATMLNKEYGHKSPWVGISAYGVATATGLMRMANNKHWLSDVLTGAGIGILSTEVGYYLADLIFKEKGLHATSGDELFDRWERPSFIGLHLGLNLPLSRYDLDEHTELKASTGSTAGIEGAYFFNPYIGVGSRLSASTSQIIVNEDQAVDHSFDAMSAAAGPYLSYPLTERWLAGFKVLGGVVHYGKLKVLDQTVSKYTGFFAGCGVSMTYRARRHYAVRFYYDYDMLPPHSSHSGERIHMTMLGASVEVMFPHRTRQARHAVKVK